MNIDQQDIASLQTTFDCTVEVVTNNPEKDELNLSVICKDEAILLFYCEKPKQLAVKFVESTFEPEETGKLEVKMNQILRTNTVQQKLVHSIRSVMKLLKDTVYEHANPNVINPSFVTMPEKCSQGSGCSSRVSEEGVATKKTKKINLSPKFSNQMSTSSSLHDATKAFSKKKPPMKTAQDVINRIKWDKALDLNCWVVGYEDRFFGIVEREFVDFDWDSDISSVGPDVLAIPQHRIHYFKYQGRFVWNKDNRLDNVFGSTGDKKTILDVMKEDVLPTNNEECSSAMEVGQNVDVANSNEVSSESAAAVSDQTSSQTSKKRTRPNYFVGFRVNQDDIVASVSTYMKQLSYKLRNANDREVVGRSMSSLEKLHITFCVCRLENDEDIRKVEEVLQQCYVETEALDVFFTGIGNFNRSVVFGKPHCKYIYPLQERLVDQLKDKGINVIEDFPGYTPHLTILQLPRKQGHLYNKVANFLDGKKSKKWKFGVGPQRVTEIVLCKIGSTGDDGFYDVTASGPLQSRPDLHTEPCGKKMRGSREMSNPDSVNSKDKAESKQRKFDVRLGMTLSGILRHNKLGFRVDSGGYVEVETILKHKRFASVTIEDIHRVVANNSKKRFTIDRDENEVERIKANQGHTVEVEDLTLTEVKDPSKYPVVIHGTFYNAWFSIRREGLHRRKRIHIHMTTAEPADGSDVISGMRRSCDVFIYIDIASAIKDGIKFYLSTNGVILSSGDKRGYLKPKYFHKVFGIKKNKRHVLVDHLESRCSSESAESEDEDDVLKDIVMGMVDKLVSEETSVPDSESVEKDNPP